MKLDLLRAAKDQLNAPKRGTEKMAEGISAIQEVNTFLEKVDLDTIEKDPEKELPVLIERLENIAKDVLLAEKIARMRGIAHEELEAARKKAEAIRSVLKRQIAVVKEAAAAAAAERELIDMAELMTYEELREVLVSRGIYRGDEGRRRDERRRRRR